MSARLLAPLALLLALGTACSQENPESAGDAADESGAAASESPSASSSEDAAGGSGEGECSYPADGQGAAKEATPPPASPERSGRVPLTIETSAGTLRAELDADAAPCTVNSFVSLAEQGYFDDTECHRLTTQGIYVLQCGDPSGTGMGGPGYSFDDELTGQEKYDAGTLAMANAGPNTNGSQFFIVYQDSSDALQPLYNVFGQLDEKSVTTVTEVARKGTDTGAPDGAPKDPVEISGVTVG